ncbi:MAG: IclR family transcriptional regulator [Rhodospirillales bacterium]
MAEQSKAARDKDERELVQSLARGLAVIQAFGAETPRMTLTEVAGRTGLTRAAARRFLMTLKHLGHVGSDGRYFFLRPRILDLGYAYLSSLPWWQVCQPHMESLSKAVGESCSLSVLDGDEIVYVARVAASRIMSINLNVGTRLPAYCTSMGRALLAELEPELRQAYLARVELKPLTGRTVIDPAALEALLEKVRKQGFSLVDQELEDGLTSIAVPIRDRSGQVIAALNISAPAGAVTSKTMTGAYLDSLKTAAGRITQSLPH